MARKILRPPWVRTDRLRNGNGGIAWEADYKAHPMLDPDFLQGSSRLLRFLQMTFERITESDENYVREAARLLQPPGAREGGRADLEILAEYLREADIYLYEATQLLPHEARGHVRLAPQVGGCHDLRCLLSLLFNCADPRVRFEAQRKLCIAKLLIDIENSRQIQDGPKHKEYFERLLEVALWRHVTQRTDLAIGFHMDDTDGESIRYTSRPGADDQRWTFHSEFLQKREGERVVSLDILYHNCRFKRTVEPISFEIVDGHHRVIERVRWGQMRRHRSGSVLSKMIRKGINNPDEIGDLIGAMFIVHDEEALNDLLRLLDSSIGNPLGWRNVTDTLASDRDRATLDRHSGRGFKVFKGDVDILYPGEAGHPPYRFQVEVQIYTLEAYLRTVCGAHEASHLALKLRQFLYGLVPMLFPRAIYGEGWLELE